MVSRLLNLETLDMTSSRYHWSVKGEAQNAEATVEEIGCLQRLHVLSIKLHSSPCLLTNTNIWIKRLRKFQLIFGSGYMVPTRQEMRRVTISHLDVSQGSIGWLLSSTTSLALNHCQGVEAMIQKLVIDNMSFKNLKALTIESTSIKLNSKQSFQRVDLLPNLEELHLRCVDLETISELQIHLGLSLESLKLLEITMCLRLRTLLDERNFKSIPNLEEIEISYCDSFQRPEST
ncbi:Disease resistance protein [Cardamine amara subsp. amara]|uniref:Disease resistance protein n=1 Tax=Cardamine amara subsp. amara TaxID=228776 RepID=A0ABD1B869_CARAN